MADKDKFSAIEEFRNPYESDHEWRLRRDFMLVNYGKFPDEKLVCMANCYINAEVYGCRYPLMVMGQINEMREGLDSLTSPELPTRLKGLVPVQFVKSNHAENDTDNTDEVEQRKADETSKIDADALKSVDQNKGKLVQFVKSSTELTSNEVTLQTPSCQLLKSKFLDDCQPKSVSHSSVAVSNCHIKRGHWAKVSKPEVQTEEDGSNLEESECPELVAMVDMFVKIFKQYRAAHPNRPSVDVFHMSATKCRFKVDVVFQDLSTRTEHKFYAIIMLENIELAHGQDSNKKGAKKRGYDAAEEKLLKPNLKIVKINPEKIELQGSDDLCEKETKNSLNVSQKDIMNKESTDNTVIQGLEINSKRQLQKNRKRKISELHGDLTRFIIFEHMNEEQNANAVSILRRSADASKADLEYVFHEESTGTRCRLSIDGQVIVEYMGTSKTNAKTIASERTLERLQQICWTIRIKQAVDSDQSGISRDEVMGEIKKQMESIPEDNVGNRLLRKMGWIGGGVGADGNKGKEEPVAVSMAAHTIIRREGLGLQSSQTMVDFKKKVKDVIQNYAQSERQDDLAFAACFSKEERAFIHQQCCRLGLKSQSRGTGNERYLTVSRKRSAAQLFEHLMKEGGNSHKYELVPPLYDT